MTDIACFFHPAQSKEPSSASVLEFHSKCGEQIILCDIARAPIDPSTLHPGWSIQLLISGASTLLAVLVRAQERALWIFDRNGILLTTSFNSATEAAKSEVEALLVDALSLSDGSAQNVEFQKQWAENCKVLTPAALEEVVSYHLSSLQVILVDHDCDVVQEAVLGLVRTAETTGVAKLRPDSIGDTALFYKAAANQKLEFVSPESGKWLTGTKCIFRENNHLIYPLSSNEEFGYLVALGSSIIFPAVFYLPHMQKVFVTNREPFAREAIAHLRGTIDKILEDYALIESYMRLPPGHAAGFVFISHIGHHLWNELSGLEKASGSRALEGLKRIYSLWPDRGEHFGNVDKLYGKSPDYVERVREGNIFPFCLYSRNEMVLRLSEGFVPQSLTKRIVDFSFRQEHDFGENASQIMSDYNVKILISPRFENRTWLNQVEEITRCVEALLSDGYRVCLVFDGHNNNNSKDGFFRSHEEKQEVSIVRLEQQMVEGFRAHFAQRIGIIDNIGGSVARSIILTNLTDFFVVPWGAGLAKYKWAGGGWGVIASNKFCISEKGDRLIYEDSAYVENAFPDIWYSVEHVSDEHPPTAETLLEIRDRGNFRTAEHSLLSYVRMAIGQINPR